MKLITVYTQSHRPVFEEWAFSTLKDNYELSSFFCDVEGSGKYLEKDWTQAVLFKNQKIIETIKENWGRVFIYSDVDIQFFAPTKRAILKAIKNKDIACQIDNPRGSLCTGFFAIRANSLTLNLWQKVHEAVQIERRDQKAFNRLIRNINEIRRGYLPQQFFGAGTFRRQIWRRGVLFFIPKSPIMFHANWTIGIENKIELLGKVRKIVAMGSLGITINNILFYFKCGFNKSQIRNMAQVKSLVDRPS